ncbi:MAG: helix-turn-helix transcriptional regulator [Planctomycetales bacterium]|nr:helix-turn-helix transcriptional regulator [bacterium]UNM09949.1 MAG: helix-turn-helix transcriptional regulator [Planctomycetales bacterium]
MPAFRIGNHTYANPVQLALELVGGKWRMPILWRLKDGPLRYSELKRSLNRAQPVAGISDRALTIQLRELEASGMLSRQVFAEVPPHTEYSITKRGQRALPVIRSLQRFGSELAIELGAVELDAGH